MWTDGVLDYQFCAGPTDLALHGLAEVRFIVEEEAALASRYLVHGIRFMGITFG